MTNVVRTVLYAAARPVVGGEWLGERLGVRPRTGRVRAGVAFLAALLVLFCVWSGWLYPLRPDTIGVLGRPFDPTLPTAWGGPTLVGAWVTHALVALAIQVACVVVIRAAHGRAR